MNIKIVLVLLGTGLIGFTLTARQTLETHITIEAPREKVWEVLTDTARYAEWVSFLQVDGAYEIGKKVTVTFHHPNGKSDSFVPTVLRVDQPEHLMWRGGKGAWLFAAEHHFELLANDDGSTTFKHYEYFSGILAPFIWWYIKKKTVEAFHRMNAALKQHVENEVSV